MNDLSFTFAVRDDLVIVGTNSEMADFDNRRGEIEGLAHYIVAEAPDGRRFAHNAVCFTTNGYVINGNDDVDVEDECLTTFRVDSNGLTVERLERLAAHLNATHPELDEACWTETQAMYGSDAYVRDGWEDVAIAIEREEARYQGR